MDSHCLVPSLITLPKMENHSFLQQLAATGFVNKYHYFVCCLVLNDEIILAHRWSSCKAGVDKPVGSGG